MIVNSFLATLRQQRGLPVAKRLGPAPDLVFFTGDIAYSGMSQEYERAREFFDELMQLLQLGRRLFNERAYDEISIDDIAAAAGISKGLLYHYFSSKRVFYVETVRAAATEMIAITAPPPQLSATQQLDQGRHPGLGRVVGDQRPRARAGPRGVGHHHGRDRRGRTGSNG